jgi:cell division protein FtsB
VSLATGAAARTRRRGGLTPRAAILGLVLMALLLYLAVPVQTYLTQRRDMARLQQQMHVLEQQSGKLRAQVRQLHDPNYLERIARECLGMVKRGEIGFVIVPNGGAAQPPDC